MADLSVKYLGLKLKSPLIVASGPRSDTVEACVAAAEAGFGAVILKSLSSSRGGPETYKHAVPRFTVVDRVHPTERWTPKKGMQNMDIASAEQVGSIWHEDEYVKFVSDIKRAVGDDLKVGASFFGAAARVEVWEELANVLKDCEADFVETPLGPWHFRGLLDLKAVIKRVKEILPMPFTPKLPAFLTLPVETAKMLQEAGVDGLTLFDPGANTIDFDINTLKPPFRGGTSYFPAGMLASHTRKAIADCRLADIKVDISASAAAWEWQDIVKSMMCGANTVQTCRRIMLRGYKEGSLWLKEVNNWLDEKNYQSINEIQGKMLSVIGTNARKSVPREVPLERGGFPSLIAVVDREKCAGCVNLCTNACAYFAITVVDKKASIEKSKCACCGMCEGICPELAISLVSRT